MQKKKETNFSFRLQLQELHDTFHFNKFAANKAKRISV